MTQEELLQELLRILGAASEPSLVPDWWKLREEQRQLLSNLLDNPMGSLLQSPGRVDSRIRESGGGGSPGQGTSMPFSWGEGTSMVGGYKAPTISPSEVFTSLLG